MSNDDTINFHFGESNLHFQHWICAGESPMTKYRKKVLVDAQEVTKDGQMDTKTGTHHYKRGDFIITNPDGERYPCPKDARKCVCVKSL